MRTGVRLAVLVAAGALLATGAVVVATRAGRPERVWAFVPSPPWSEDPPPHAAATEGGVPLPSAAWTTVIGTSGGGPSSVLVMHSPSPVFRRLMRVLGRTPSGDTYTAIDDGRPVSGGRWHECALIDSDAANAAAAGHLR